jgi:hypothetical protein
MTHAQVIQRKDAFYDVCLELRKESDAAAVARAIAADDAARMRNKANKKAGKAKGKAKAAKLKAAAQTQRE